MTSQNGVATVARHVGSDSSSRNCESTPNDQLASAKPVRGSDSNDVHGLSKENTNSSSPDFSPSSSNSAVNIAITQSPFIVTSNTEINIFEVVHALDKVLPNDAEIVNHTISKNNKLVYFSSEINRPYYESSTVKPNEVFSTAYFLEPLYLMTT